MPKSKFDQGKKTVGFIENESVTPTSFKIKTKKVRSEKTIEMVEEGRDAKTAKRTPKFISNKSSKQLPPLEK